MILKQNLFVIEESNTPSNQPFQIMQLLLKLKIGRFVCLKKGERSANTYISEINIESYFECSRLKYQIELSKVFDPP